VGPTFAGSVDLAADADLIAGGLLLELKVNLGDRNSDGGRRCSLDRQTVYELLGYLLLDYEDAYRIEALGVYSARYAHLAIWPLAELLDVLAGGPVDFAQERAEFRQIVLATPNPAAICAPACRCDGGGPLGEAAGGAHTPSALPPIADGMIPMSYDRRHGSRQASSLCITASSSPIFGSTGGQESAAGQAGSKNGSAITDQCEERGGYIAL
jgi:hypothetical protein